MHSSAQPLMPPITSNSARRRGYIKQLLATNAAREHPGTFELYVHRFLPTVAKTTVTTGRGVSPKTNSSSNSTGRCALPHLQDASTLPSGEEHDGVVSQTVVPHPPIRKRVDPDHLPDSLLRAFPHLKHHNMKYRHGTPPLPAFTLEWNAQPRVDCRRMSPPSSPGQCPTAARKPRRPQPPKPRDASAHVAPATAVAKLRSRGSVLYYTQLRQLTEDLVDFELRRRRSVSRDCEAELLKLLRHHEDLRNGHVSALLHEKSDLHKHSRQLARSICVDALAGALNVRGLEDRESGARGSVAHQESHSRNKITVLFMKRVGFALPETIERESIENNENVRRSALRCESLASLEELQRDVLVRTQRDAFDDMVVMLDILASSCSVDARECALRTYLMQDERLDRLLVVFHGSFRELSLSEMEARLILRKASTDGLRGITKREVSAIKIQALQRGVAARRATEQMRSDQMKGSVSELLHRQALSKVATKRAMLTAALRDAAQRAKANVAAQSHERTEIEKVVFHWVPLLEDIFLDIANCTDDDPGIPKRIETYRAKKTGFAMALAPFQPNGATSDAVPEEVSVRVTDRCRRIVELILREADSDRANIMLLNALSQTAALRMGAMVIEDDLLLDAIADGSCNYFDVLLGMLPSATTTALSASQCKYYVTTALGSPTKRILFAGTILRRERVLQLPQHRTALQPLWQDFYWSVSCRSALCEDIEDGLSLREPLLLLLATHHNVSIDFCDVPVHNNEKQLSLFARLCRDAREVELVQSLISRCAGSSESLRAALKQESGVTPFTPLGHAIVVGNVKLVEFLLSVDEVRVQERENNSGARAWEYAPDDQKEKLRALLDEHP